MASAATAVATATVSVITVTASSVVTVTATATHVAKYYDTWVGGITTIAAANAVLSLLVMGIVGFSLFIFVAMLSSMGAALSYGVAFIQWYRTIPTASANLGISIFTDLCWLIQGASLSFYSFLIVRKIVRNRERIIYLSVFWGLMMGICGTRFGIMSLRIVAYVQGLRGPQNTEDNINQLHVSYFALVAACETWNAYFLLKKFYKANKNRATVLRSASTGSNSLNPNSDNSNNNRKSLAIKGGFYAYFLTSSELRLASLASIGILRALIWGMRLQGVAQQFDTFAATMEIVFPNVFLIDVLASKLAFQDHIGIFAGGRQDQGNSGSTGLSHGSRYSYAQAAQNSAKGEKPIHDEESVVPGRKSMTINTVAVL